MKTLRAALAILCIAVVTLCAILIVQKVAGRVRVDLTQSRLYTLSQGTRDVLARLNQPVHLKLYYARTAAMNGPEEIRFYNNYYLYVRDLLQEYASRSGGMLTLAIIDPRPFSDEEEDAIRQGVQRFPLTDDESFFFGMTASTELGNQKAIPFFEPDRQQFVEYDISRLISTVTQRAKKKVGVLSSLPVLGAEMSPYLMQMMQAQGRTPPQPWAIVGQLQDEYTLVPVQPDADSISADTDYLMVIHPKALPDKMLYAIDQYVMRGGNLIVFEDPYCMADQPGQDPQNPFGDMDYKSSSDLNRLTKAWGVEMDLGSIAVDRALALSASVSRGAPAARVLPFLGLDERSMNPSEVVTGDLHEVRMLFAGVLKPVPEAGTKVVPLLQTTATGNVWKPTDPMALRMLDPDAINRAVPDGTTPLMLACRVTGKFKTNFPDGLPAAPKPEAAPKPDAAPKDQPANPSGDDPPAAVATPAAATPAAAAPAPATPPTAAPAPAAPATAAPPAATPAAAEAPKAEPPASPAAKPEAAPAEPAKPEAKKPETLKETAGEGTILVFADVDMLTDMLAFQSSFFGQAQVGDNVSLVLNALEFLGGGSDLIGVRSRGRYNRPFVVVDRIEAAAEKATATQVDALNQKIADYEQKLDTLAPAGTEKEAKLLHSTALAERDKVEGEIREARGELRKLNAGKREQIEALKAQLQTNNLVWAPSVVLLIAIVLAIGRRLKARRYVARRTQQ